MRGRGGRALALAQPQSKDVDATFGDEPSRREQLLGVIAVLANALVSQSLLAAPDDRLYEDLAADISALPPQVAHIDAQSPFARWLSVAALAEHWRELRLAQLIVDRLSALVRDTSPRAKGAFTGGDAAYVLTQDAAELAGICFARRGRIARSVGDLDDAIQWYRDAAQIVRARERIWRDARVLAELGLATIDTLRGNMPAVERRTLRILAYRPQVADFYRVHAHQFLALTRRKAGKYIDALLNAWAAFDLLDHADFRRQELVASMSEIALEMGDVLAAESGFAAVLTAAESPRVRIPAVVGLLQVRLRVVSGALQDDSVAVACARELEDLLRTSLAPNDEVVSLLALAEFAQRSGQVAHTTELLDRADHVARQQRLYERQFQIEALRGSLNGGLNTMTVMHSDVNLPMVPASINSAGAAPSASRAARRRHPALQRLLATQDVRLHLVVRA
jgi:tetratricopeptide (TPR) repeat protein